MSVARLRAFLQYQLALFRARLSWRVTFGVFLGIVVVEAVILVPSLERKYAGMVDAAEAQATALIVPIALHAPEARSLAQLQTLLPPPRNSARALTGATLYDHQGQVLVKLGKESPSLPPHGQGGATPTTPPGRIERLVDLEGSEATSARWLALRFESAPFTEALSRYSWQLLGLVAGICLIVTIVTMVVLNILVIDPIFALRNAVTQVARAHSGRGGQVEFHCRHLTRGDEIGDVTRAFSTMNATIGRYIEAIEAREARLRTLLGERNRARRKAERLLYNILPKPVADRLQAGETSIAEHFDAASVLFADIVGFTHLATHTDACSLVGLLNEIFTTFDRLVAKHGLEKIKTIGDAYMVVGGVPTARADHADATVALALDMQQAVTEFRTPDGEPVTVRIGINSGPVVAGVIGIRKTAYDLWGETVNLASRIESHGLPGRIQMSAATYRLLTDTDGICERGAVNLKGLGETVCYLVARAPADKHAPPAPSSPHADGTDAKQAGSSNRIVEDPGATLGGRASKPSA